MYVRVPQVFTHEDIAVTVGADNSALGDIGRPSEAVHGTRDRIKAHEPRVVVIAAAEHVELVVAAVCQRAEVPVVGHASDRSDPVAHELLRLGIRRLLRPPGRRWANLSTGPPARFHHGRHGR